MGDITEFSSWEEILAVTDDLVGKFRQQGFSEQAERLGAWSRDARSGVWSSGLEMCGELGAVVRAIQADGVGDVEVRAALERLGTAARQAWS